MQLFDLFPESLYREMVDQGYIKGQVNSEYGFTLLNYANKCQFEGVWNAVTLNCRGLIFDSTGEIISRPFQKFFNHDQSQAPDWTQWARGDVRIQDKLDGSLGICYPTPDGPAIATRGSFFSEQAVWATNFLRKNYPGWTPETGQTFLFEVIYPENRIVVDYGDMEDLVLLDVLDNETGDSLIKELPHSPDYLFRMAQQFTFGEFEKQRHPREDGEGWVLTNLRTNERVKIKLAEYKRLHKLLTGVSSKTIWELLKNEQPLDDILDVVPDEFYDWVKKTSQDLRDQVDEIFIASRKEFVSKAPINISGMPVDPKGARKDFALSVKDSPYKDLLFGMYDNRSIHENLWKRVEPKYAKPFWNDDDN